MKRVGDRKRQDIGLSNLVAREDCSNLIDLDQALDKLARHEALATQDVLS